MDRAIFCICRVAAAELDSNLRNFLSSKLLIDVCSGYDSANFEVPNYKAFEALLVSNPITIEKYPLNEGNMHDSYKPFRAALKDMADRVLAFNSRLNQDESGYVLLQIIDCQLRTIKLTQIGFAYHPLSKHLAVK